MAQRVAGVLELFRGRAVSGRGLGTDQPFDLVCALESPASRQEIRAAWPGLAAADEIVECWLTCRSARLFEDVEHGQWGLRILSPAESAETTSNQRRTRPGEFGPGDLVLGKFLGDSELLVIGQDQDVDRVLVASPLDSRAEWFTAAPTLTDFLQLYSASAGAKFWEA